MWCKEGTFSVMVVKKITKPTYQMPLLPVPVETWHWTGGTLLLLQHLRLHAPPSHQCSHQPEAKNSFPSTGCCRLRMGSSCCSLLMVMIHVMIWMQRPIIKKSLDGQRVQDIQCTHPYNITSHYCFSCNVTSEYGRDMSLIMTITVAVRTRWHTHRNQI